MKIALIQEEPTKKVGGGAVLFLLMTKELTKRGHSVCLISNPIVESLLPLYPEGLEIHQVIKSDPRPASQSSVIKRLVVILKSRVRMNKVIESFHPDIVCCGGEYPGILGLTIKHRFRIPVILFKFHNVFEAWHNLATFPKGHLLNFLEKLSLRLPFDAFISNAYNYKVFNSLRFKSRRARFNIITPGVDSDLFTYKGNRNDFRKKLGLEDKKILLYAGALDRNKKVDRLIEAIKMLAVKYPDCHLLVVGTGTEEERLIQLAKIYGLENFITFTGQKPYSEIADYIIASDVIVVPSLSELFGSRTMYDAWALKRPVVATAVGDVPDIAKDYETALLIPPEDTQAIVEKVEQIFSNAGLREKLVENAYQEVKKYSSEKLAEMFLEVCEQVVKNRGS